MRRIVAWLQFVFARGRRIAATRRLQRKTDRRNHR